MNEEGPDSDIVLSSRIRLARNMKQYSFPTVFTNEEAMQIVQLFEQLFSQRRLGHIGPFSY